MHGNYTGDHDIGRLGKAGPDKTVRACQGSTVTEIHEGKASAGLCPYGRFQSTVPNGCRGPCEPYRSAPGYLIKESGDSGIHVSGATVAEYAHFRSGRLIGGAIRWGEIGGVLWGCR